MKASAFPSVILCLFMLFCILRSAIGLRISPVPDAGSPFIQDIGLIFRTIMILLQNASIVAYLSGRMTGPKKTKKRTKGTAYIKKEELVSVYFLAETMAKMN